MFTIFKKCSVVIALIALLFASYSCDSATASKPAANNVEDENNELQELGFTNVPAVKIKREAELRQEYYSKTGLQYLTLDSLGKFATQNNFTIAVAEKFKGDIPLAAQKEIISNYKKLSAITHYYHDDFWNALYRVGYDRYGDKDPFDRKGIWVVAPKEMFLPDPPKRDPIAVVRVDEGWLILAAWE